MRELRSLTAARRALDSGELSPAELAEAARCRARTLDRGDRPVRAFLSVADPEEEDGAETQRSPVAGVPVALKDNLCTLSLPTTCASRILEGYRSPFEATAVRRLRAAGARILGKTNMDEFAMGSSTENSAFGPSRNPVDRDRVPGGSSGGSAAAVAAGVVPVALGSDTGGSVRQPAAFCGVVGVKPTYGRVSRYGLVAFASSLDQVGVLAGSVADGARTLELLAGHDRRDATSADRPPPRWEAAREAELEGAVVGVPAGYRDESVEPEVRTALREAARALESGGAELREVTLPDAEGALACYHVLAPAEASSNLARYDGVRYGRRAEDGRDPDEMYAATRGRGFGPEVKRRIMIGTYSLSAGYYEDYYLRARALQREIARSFRRVFDAGVDALLTPTTPGRAFRLGARTGGDPYRMYRSDVFTVSANLAGLPAVSVPVAAPDGLPVGAQILCPPWEEERMLGLAGRLEERMDFVHPLREAG